MFSLVFSRMLNVYYDVNTDTMASQTLLLMYGFFAFGVVSGATQFLQPWLFSVAGEALTRRLRQQTFEAIVKQDMAFFDAPVRTLAFRF
jgi:hypothetical protein